MEHNPQSGASRGGAAPGEGRPPFSLSMCVYGKDNPEWFDMSLRSVIEQTAPPTEIVLVVDGPVPAAIDAVIDRRKSIFDAMPQTDGMVVVRLKENQGNGVARREGLARCRHDLVAIADADDISVPDRFEKELGAFMADPELSVVGSCCRHFTGEVGNIIYTETLPQSDAGIKRLMRTRCPICQPSSMIRRSAALAAGSYQSWFRVEDYHLYIRMALGGAKFMNLQECLLYVRVSEDQLMRRGGMRYFRSCARLFGFMLQKGMISLPTYLYDVLGRFAVQVLMPPALRGAVRKKLKGAGRPPAA